MKGYGNTKTLIYTVSKLKLRKSLTFKRAPLDELSLADKEVSLTKEKHKCGIKVDSQNGATACVRCDFIKIELDKFKDLSFQQQKKLVTLEAQQTESEENYESVWGL